MTNWKKNGCPRRTHGLKSLTTPLQHLCIEKLSHTQLQTYQLFSHWTDIVGEEIAHQLTPIKTSYDPKDKIEILHVNAIQEGAGFFFQYQKDSVLEKINGYFGHPVYGRIRLVSGHKRKSSSQKARTAIPCPEQQATPLPKEVKEKLSHIKDETLQKKLQNLYQSFSASRNR